MLNIEAGKVDQKISIMADKRLREALEQERARMQRETGLRASLSAIAAAILRRGLEQPQRS